MLQQILNHRLKHAQPKVRAKSEANAFSMHSWLNVNSERSLAIDSAQAIDIDYDLCCNRYNVECVVEHAGRCAMHFSYHVADTLGGKTRTQCPSLP